MTFLLIAILVASIGALRPNKSSSLFAQSIMPMSTIGSDPAREGFYPLMQERRQA